MVIKDNEKPQLFRTSNSIVKMVGEIPTQLCCTVFYRMAKINCHLNQYNACVNSLRYCALSRKPIELKIHSLEISYIRTTAAVRCDRVCNTKHLSCDLCRLPCDIIIGQCDKKFQPYDKTVIASIPQKYWHYAVLKENSRARSP